MSPVLCTFEEHFLLATKQHRFTIQADSDILAARTAGRALANQLGFSATDGALVATAISELARNILIHAGTGEIVIEEEHHSAAALVITACDRGPGIHDVELAMRDGYSTYGGLGLGLPGTRRVMDHFEIISRPGAGTTVTVKKFLQPISRNRV